MMHYKKLEEFVKDHTYGVSVTRLGNMIRVEFSSSGEARVRDVHALSEYFNNNDWPTPRNASVRKKIWEVPLKR